MFAFLLETKKKRVADRMLYTNDFVFKMFTATGSKSALASHFLWFHLKIRVMEVGETSQFGI